MFFQWFSLLQNASHLQGWTAFNSSASMVWVPSATHQWSTYETSRHHHHTMPKPTAGTVLACISHRKSTTDCGRIVSCKLPASSDTSQGDVYIPSLQQWKRAPASSCPSWVLASYGSTCRNGLHILHAPMATCKGTHTTSIKTSWGSQAFGVCVCVCVSCIWLPLLIFQGQYVITISKWYRDVSRLETILHSSFQCSLKKKFRNHAWSDDTESFFFFFFSFFSLCLSWKYGNGFQDFPCFYSAESSLKWPM